MCVFRNTPVYAHSSSWSALNPWVLPGADFFLQDTCVCVLTAAIGLPKLLNVQNLHLTSSLIILQHTRVCSQQQLVGQAAVDLFCNTCACLLTAATVCQSFEVIKAKL